MRITAILIAAVHSGHFKKTGDDSVVFDRTIWKSKIPANRIHHNLNKFIRGKNPSRDLTLLNVTFPDVTNKCEFFIGVRLVIKLTQLIHAF